MPDLTPIQESFSAGEISPLMYMRASTEGYQQGVAEMVNMFADSRGAAYSRLGSQFKGSFVANDARIIAIPVNDNSFYSGVFTAENLSIVSPTGSNPSVVYNINANFNLRDDGWTTVTDGDVQSTAIFNAGKVDFRLPKQSNRFVYITQEVDLPSTGNYKMIWTMFGDFPVQYSIGTTSGGTDIYSSLESVNSGEEIISMTSTTVWMTVRIDSDNIDPWDTSIAYFGLTEEVPSPVSFVTPYAEQDLSTLQGIGSPSGGAIYVVHELYPPYKLVYDRETDAFTWLIVDFLDDSLADTGSPCSGVSAIPPEWVAGSYPSTGDFFEGRLWLGGTVNEPQTFWASKSGCPEVFVSAELANADSPLQFTMAKYGRIEWIIGFKNLVIGTQYGEHIVTSEGGFIKPDDIKVEQQSSYGSANVQPVQVGDQIFYVSADRRKLRAIQYEWQKDNWLSKDLTFNSEHITKAGIKHVAWQQNPANLFHCVLEDGTLATLTYERSHNVYGWSRSDFQGKMVDIATGSIQGTNYPNALISYNIGTIYYEIQPISIGSPSGGYSMDSWTEQSPDVPDGLIVSGLDHLDGFVCQVLVDEAHHPDRLVENGQITLQFTGAEIGVGLKFTPRLVTLPFDKGAPAGSGASWQKRWNKIFIRVLDSALPLINGERAPDRSPQTLMNTPEQQKTQEIMKVNLGFDKHAEVIIEQDLPKKLTVLGIFGELNQSKT